ncbi:MAG: LptA/OstA family protein [Candidatus Omnitrophota bacterium]
MNKMRNLTIALLVVFLLTGGCGKKEEPKAKEAKASKESAVPAPGDPVSHKVLSFNLEGLTERGVKKWDVKGESAEAISENEVKLDNIIASAYGEEAEAVITADEGVYDRSKNNVKLEKNVHATINATRAFTGDFVEGSGNIIRDGGAKDGADNPEKPKKDKTIITCDGEVQFDYEKNQAYFLKNVKVVNSDGTIDADKITVHLDPGTRRLKEIVAEGNVRIVRGDNTTFSQRASYSESDKKVTLSGRPKLILSPDGGMGFDTNFTQEGKK